MQIPPGRAPEELKGQKGFSIWIRAFDLYLFSLKRKWLSEKIISRSFRLHPEKRIRAGLWTSLFLQGLFKLFHG